MTEEEFAAAADKVRPDPALIGRDLACLAQITSGLLASGSPKYTCGPVSSLADEAEKILRELTKRATRRALLVAVDQFIEAIDEYEVAELAATASDSMQKVLDKADSNPAKSVEEVSSAGESVIAQPRKNRQPALARRLKMKLKRSTRKAIMGAPGFGIRVYDDREKHETQLAIARFNTRLLKLDEKAEAPEGDTIGGLKE